MRQRIQSEFRKQQLMLDKEALALLVDYVEQAATGLDAVYTIIEKLEAGTKFYDRSIANFALCHRCFQPLITLCSRECRFADNHSRLTGPLVQEVIQRLGNAPTGAVLVQAFDSFDLPKVRFDNVRQRFYPLKEPLTIHATAQVPYSPLK